MLASTRDPRFSPEQHTPPTSRTHYDLVCARCQLHIPDDGAVLACPNGCAALLHSNYIDRCFAPLKRHSNLARYSQWLPGAAHHLTAALPHITKLPWLCDFFRLPQLYVALSGRWPRHKAVSATGSFKDLEACTVLARLRKKPDVTVVLASAGNTALAFAAEATRQDRACVIVITAETCARLRLPSRLGSKVHVVVVDGDARYDDAIAVSQALANDPRFVLEGGIRNIARRDGVGTVMLAALEHIGQLPHAYIQAVGSAAGAVAVHEMAKRTLINGHGSALPRLVLSQNLPFAPLMRSWNSGSRELLIEDDESSRKQVGQINAGVLSNLRPPYGISGGIRECLTESNGVMLGVNNAAEQAMRERFWNEERIVLDPAAAVAAASLMQLPKDIRSANQPLLLHLTGAAPLENTSRFSPQNEYHIALGDIKKAEHLNRIRDEISAKES